MKDGLHCIEFIYVYQFMHPSQNQTIDVDVARKSASQLFSAPR